MMKTLRRVLGAGMVVGAVIVATVATTPASVVAQCGPIMKNYYGICQISCCLQCHCCPKDPC
jgi:hypothetical protein